MTAAEIVALVLRFVVGATVATHGWNHLFGPGGLQGTAGWFASMGLRPARLHAALSGVGELACGLALILGLFTPIAAAFVVGVMTVAGVVAHRRNGFFVFKDGYEYVVVLAVVSVCIAILGPGRVSVDHAVGVIAPLDGLAGAAIAASGLLGAGVMLAACWRPASSANKASG